MNNLKRILSLALASVMLVGMMVVGASATDYPDDDKIVNKEAVDTLAALGIMNGDERGFRPEDGLTRAEAAKMLAKIHNKGRDVTFGVKDVPTFKDTKGHWAEGNIEYAYAFGIVNGRGNGIFDPQGELRVVELARMVLNMMGYDEGKTGSDWELQTIVSADNNGLFAGLDSVDPTAKATRDTAAQILCNALYADMADGEAYTYDDTEPVTTGLATMWQICLKGTAPSANWGEGKTAADWTALEGTNYDTKAKANAAAKAVTTAAALDTNYELVSVLVPVIENRPVTKTAIETLGHKYLSMQKKVNAYITKVTADDKGTYTVNMSNGDTYEKVKTDYSNLMGQQVQVLYKATNNVYGITALGSVVFEGTVGEYETTYTNMAPSTTKTAIGEAKIYDFNNFSSTETRDINTNIATLADEVSLKIVRNDSTFLAVITPKTLVRVNGLTNTTVTLSGMGAAKKINEDAVIFDGIARGDYVLATPAANAVSGMIELEKVETASGVVSGLRGTSALIDGKWYNKATGALAFPALGLGDEVDLVLVNGYYAFAAAKAATASKDLLIVTQIAGQATGGLNSYTEAKALFLSDNSTKVIKLPSTVAGTNTLIGKVCNYSVRDDIYTLTEATANSAGYDGRNAGQHYDTTTNRIGTANVADDTVVVVMYKNKTSSVTGNTTVSALSDLTNAEVIDGKTLKSWKTNFGATTGAVCFFDNVNGIPYAKVVLLAANAQNLPGAAGQTGNFGYVVSAPYMISESRTTYLTYDLWNGSEVVSVKDTDTTSLIRGTVIKYTDKGNGIITRDTLTGLNPDAVVGYNAVDGNIRFATSPANAITDKTLILYVDSTPGAQAGVDAGAIQIATEDDVVAGRYTKNVMVMKNSSNNNVDVLIVDVNNDIHVSGALDVPVSTRLSSIVRSVTLPTDATTPVVLDPTTATAYTCKTGDVLAADDGTALYTSGIFETDIQDSTSTVWYVYSVKVTNSTQDDVFYKLVRTNGGSTEVTRQPTFKLAAGESATLTMICGDKLDAKFEIKSGASQGSETTVAYTLTWDAPNA